MGSKIRKARPSGRVRLKKEARPTSVKRQKRIHSRASTQKRQAARKFVKDLLVRGEAARVAEGSGLPLSATHEMVGKEREGLPVVRRRRFHLA